MINKYSISLELQPLQRSLTAVVHLSCQVPENAQTLEFFLHRDLHMTAVEGEIAGYSRADRSFTFAPESVTWVLDLPEEARGSRVEMTFKYSGVLPEVIPVDWHVNRISPQWVELGMYAPWFPWNPEYGPFTYQVEVDIDPSYTVAGLGQTRRQDTGWLITSIQPVEDIVITAAKNYCCAQEQSDICLSVYYTEPGDADFAQAIARDGMWTLEFFKDWLGDVQKKSDLAVIIAPRYRGGGYARPGLIMMQALDEAARQRTSFVGYVAHELAHLWWNSALTSTWQDWLNEAFAEYCAVKAVGARQGAEVFDRVMENKRKSMQGLPPVRGLERRDEKAFPVLYNKAAVLLQDLELLVGEVSFTKLLRLRLQENIHTSEEFLALLARLEGQDMADKFSQWLDA